MHVGGILDFLFLRLFFLLLIRRVSTPTAPLRQLSRIFGTRDSRHHAYCGRDVHRDALSHLTHTPANYCEAEFIAAS